MMKKWHMTAFSSFFVFLSLFSSFVRYMYKYIVCYPMRSEKYAMTRSFYGKRK